jgi:uncharacterized protein involved in outer membrane biogenesis
MNKIMITVIVITLAIAGVGIYLYINVNALVKEGIERSGKAALGVEVTVDQVQISILSGSGHIKGLKVANPEGYSSSKAIWVEDIQVVLDLSSLTSDSIVIKSIIIDGPEITYETHLLASNIGELQKRAESQNGNGEPVEANSEEDESNIIIGHLEMRNSKIGVRTPLLDKPIALKLPILTLKNLGKNDDASVKKVIVEVLTALNKALVPLITENAGIGDQLKEASKNLGDKLKGLFK